MATTRAVVVITDNPMERLEAGTDGERYWLTSIRRAIDEETDVIRSIQLNQAEKDKVVLAWATSHIGEWRE